MDEADECLLQFAELLLSYAKDWKADTSTEKDIRKYIKEYKEKTKKSALSFD